MEPAWINRDQAAASVRLPPTRMRMEEMRHESTRRQVLRWTGAAAITAGMGSLLSADHAAAEAPGAQEEGYVKAPWDLRAGRPKPAE